MVFSSIFFVFGFLPAFLLAYYLTPNKLRNYTALLGSYFFYAWGAPTFVFVLLGTSYIDYLLGKGIDRYRVHAKKFLALSVFLNIGLLAYFKYAHFFVAEVATLFGLTGFHWTTVALPIGISFWTFQKLSYVIDVYRKKATPADTFSSFALYIALFPQLIAGPIVRYHDIAKQLKKRVYSIDGFFEGMWRFCVGLGKKVLIADQVGQIADATFSLGGGEITTAFAWVGALSYAMQIYFDFSGYSDMAIGISKMMGFDLLENFNRPYIARNFTDFWRRWHISLSGFMREYLYIPLGGNRKGTRRTYIHLWIVFLLSGLWHGAAWTFVLWGAYHGFFLMLDKMFWIRMSKRISSILLVPLTFVFVLFGWVLFRAETIGGAISYFFTLIGSGEPANMMYVTWPDIASNRGLFVLVLALCISLFPSIRMRIPSIRMIQVGKFSFAIMLLLLSAVSMANTSFNPFIYFRF